MSELFRLILKRMVLTLNLYRITFKIHVKLTLTPYSYFKKFIFIFSMFKLVSFTTFCIVYTKCKIKKTIFITNKFQFFVSFNEILYYEFQGGGATAGGGVDTGVSRSNISYMVKLVNYSKMAARGRKATQTVSMDQSSEVDVKNSYCKCLNIIS